MEKQAFSEKMEAVAKLLDYQWELYKERGDNYGHLIGSDQIKISAENGDYKLKGRLQFSSCYPHSKNGYAEYDSRKRVEITVSADKIPEQIAKDIQNRFLPTYLTNLQIIVERIQKSDKYEADKLAAIKKVADYLHVDMPENRDRLSIHPSIEEIRHIEAYDDTQVQFEVRVTPEKAIEILEILKR